MPRQVSLRLPDGLWERAEALAKRMAKAPELQGFPVTTSRALTQAIIVGLEELEKRYGAKKK